ncbi:MAG TPA: hypothetical protein VIW94_05425 [Acidimicrobiia bacterium]
MREKPGVDAMSQHNGAISLGADPIVVVVGVNADRIRLDSNGSEIGDWARDECEIVVDPAGRYLIRAENEELPFIPDDPVTFAEALTGTPATTSSDPQSGTSRIMVDERAPKPLTVIGFYILAAITMALGLWAVWSVIA